jgi:peroxiredoxin
MTDERTLEAVFRDICGRDGPLQERLEDFSRAVRDLSLPFADAYDTLIARLAAARSGMNAPGRGDAMPAFVLPECDGRLVSLADLKTSGPFIVSFNRGHWCEYCAIELTAFKQALHAFEGAGARVVSIMPEAQKFTGSVKERLGGGIAILSDIDNAFALEMGIAIWLGDDVRTLYLNNGLNLEIFQRSSLWFVPIPATFVVASDGTILARFVDPDFRRRMEINEILAALKST